MKKIFELYEMTLDDIEAVTRMRLQSWLDTYVNDAARVTREWIEERNKLQLSPEKLAARKDWWTSHPSARGWVARDEKGRVIGATTPYRDEEGVQHVGSLYVDKNWHGHGVGARLMKEVIDWSDPSEPIVLGVVTYNERAKAFYRKWGFEEITGSEELFDGVMPEIRMIRKGDAQ